MATTAQLQPAAPPELSAPQAPGGETLAALTRACVHTPESGHDAFRSWVRAQSRHGWTALLDVATDHSVAPLLCKRLLDLAARDLPETWRDRIRHDFVAEAHRNLLLTAELVRILRALEQVGVRAVPFKGPVLAQQAYGDLALRQFGDLDIVLPHAQLAAAHRVLEGMNFQSESAGAAMAAGRIPGQYAYRGKVRDILIELHTEKTMRYLPVPLDWKALGERLESIDVGGQSLRTFSAEDTLILICVHGSKHFWTRLAWICDVAALVQAPRGIDWQRAEECARRMRCHRMWLLGLALANEILCAPLPETLLGQIRNDARLAALVRRVREQYLPGGESGVSAADRTSFRLQTQDNLGTALRQLSIFATRPTDEDWESHSLPRWAAPLYAVLRPLRMLRAALSGPRSGR